MNDIDNQIFHDKLLLETPIEGNMRVYFSNLQLKTNLVYCFGLYKQDAGEEIDIDDIVIALHLTRPHCEKQLNTLYSKGLFQLQDSKLVFNSPTKELSFRMTAKGYPQYFLMSLVIEGSANETAILYFLNHLWKQGLTRQTTKGIGKLLGLNYRNVGKAIERLEKKGLLWVSKTRWGFTINKVKTIGIVEKPKKSVLTSEDKPAITILDTENAVPRSPLEKLEFGLKQAGLPQGQIAQIMDKQKDSFRGKDGCEYDCFVAIEEMLESAQQQHYSKHGNNQCGRLFLWKYNDWKRQYGIPI